MRAHLAMLGLLCLSSTAVADDDLPGFDHALHWQLEPGMRVGSMYLDGQSVGGVGGMLDAGVRYGRVMVLLDLSEVGVDASSLATTERVRLAGGAADGASDGTLDCVGVAARWYLARATESGDAAPLVLGDAWLSAGVGRQTYTWTAGGVLGRNDVMFGVGGTFGMHAGGWTADTRRWWGGTTMAFYVIYARRDDGMQAVACGGPCDMATAPSRDDRTLLLDWSVPFGK